MGRVFWAGETAGQRLGSAADRSDKESDPCTCGSQERGTAGPGGGGPGAVSSAAEGVRVPSTPPPPPRMTSQGLSFQLRQGSVGRGPEGHDELRIPGAQSGRLIEMERSVSVDCCAVGMRRGGPRGLAPADPPHHTGGPYWEIPYLFT